MPRLQSSKDGTYWPANPSALGLYVYTAEDLEVGEALEEAFAAAIRDEGEDDRNFPDRGFDNEEVFASSSGFEDEGDAEPLSPRKRRRIEVAREQAAGDEVELTIDYARRTTACSTLVRGVSHAPASWSIPPSKTDAGWSFRPLDENTAMEDGPEQEECQFDKSKENSEEEDEGGSRDVFIDPQLDSMNTMRPSPAESGDEAREAPAATRIREPSDIDAVTAPPATDTELFTSSSNSESKGLTSNDNSIHRPTHLTSLGQQTTPRSARQGIPSDALRCRKLTRMRCRPTDGWTDLCMFDSLHP